MVGADRFWNPGPEGSGERVDAIPEAAVEAYKRATGETSWRVARGLAAAAPLLSGGGVDDHDGVPGYWVCDKCGQPLDKDARCNSGLHVGPGEDANGTAIHTTDLVSRLRSLLSGGGEVERLRQEHDEFLRGNALSWYQRTTAERDEARADRDRLRASHRQVEEVLEAAQREVRRLRAAHPDAERTPHPLAVCERNLKAMPNYNPNLGTPAVFVCGCGRRFEYTDDEAEGAEWTPIDPDAERAPGGGDRG